MSKKHSKTIELRDNFLTSLFTRFTRRRNTKVQHYSPKSEPKIVLEDPRLILDNLITKFNTLDRSNSKLIYIMRNSNVLILDICIENLELIKVIIDIYKIQQGNNHNNILFEYSEDFQKNIIVELENRQGKPKCNYRSNKNKFYVQYDKSLDSELNIVPIIRGFATESTLLNEFNKYFNEYNNNLSNIGRTNQCQLLKLYYNEDTEMLIKILITISKFQKENFVKVYPMVSLPLSSKEFLKEKRAKSSTYQTSHLYIAINNSNTEKLPIICGYAEVDFYKINDEDDSKLYAYLEFLSISQEISIDKRKYEGIGSAIISKIEDDPDIKPNFIKLHSIDSAIGFYKKQGFINYVNGNRYVAQSLILYKTIKDRDLPTKEFIIDTDLYDSERRYLKKFYKYYNDYISSKAILTVDKLQKCNLIVLDFIRDNIDFILTLVWLADNQEDNFESIYPWDQFKNTSKNDFVYDANIKLYIAIDINDDPTDFLIYPTICGWANVSIYKNIDNTIIKNLAKQKNILLEEQRLAYIEFITVRKTLMKSGIGKNIISEIAKEDIDFIELNSLRNTVGFYKKLGFKSYTKRDLDDLNDNREIILYKTVKSKPDLNYLKLYENT